MNDFLFSLRPTHVSDYMGNDFFDSSYESRQEFEPAGEGRNVHRIETDGFFAYESRAQVHEALGHEEQAAADLEKAEQLKEWGAGYARVIKRLRKSAPRFSDFDKIDVA